MHNVTSAFGTVQLTQFIILMYRFYSFHEYISLHVNSHMHHRVIITLEMILYAHFEYNFNMYVKNYESFYMRTYFHQRHDISL